MSGYRTHGWVEFNLHYYHEALFYIQVYKIRKLAVNIKLIYTQCFYTSKVYWLMALWKSEKHSEYRFIFTAKVPQSTGFWPRVSQLRYKFGAQLAVNRLKEVGSPRGPHSGSRTANFLPINMNKA